MAITRVADTDDDGSGTTGTIRNNAWKTQIYDEIDAAIDGADATVRSVAKGGTGAATLTAHGVLLGEGTSAVTPTAVGATNTVLHGVTGADPSFSAVVEGDLSLTDLTTANVSTTKHGFTPKLPNDATKYLDGTGAYSVPSGGGTIDVGVCEGRLTLTSGNPEPTADVTGATTLYWTPNNRGSRIALYDGSVWSVLTFTEISHALGTITSGIGYDVFAYINAGNVAIEKLAWTSATARATALVLQDGVLVKSGATTRRWLGAFYASSTTTTEDSATKRFLFNHYHPTEKLLQRFESTGSWTYTIATWRQANAAAANQVEVFIGWADTLVDLSVDATVSNGTAVNVYAAIGLDSTTTPAGNQAVKAGYISGGATNVGARYVAYPALGYHKFCWLEYSVAAGTTTWYHSFITSPQAGLSGWVRM